MLIAPTAPWRIHMRPSGPLATLRMYDSCKPSDAVQNRQSSRDWAREAGDSIVRIAMAADSDLRHICVYISAGAFRFRASDGANSKLLYIQSRQLKTGGSMNHKI